MLGVLQHEGAVVQRHSEFKVIATWITLRANVLST